MAKVDDLPSEVFHEITRYLDMPERIRLRFVSKAFKKKVDEILREQTDLVISSDYTIPNRWYHSNEPFSIRDHLILTIDLDCAPSFGFDRLERIKMKNGLQDSGIKLLEKFKNLVQIEIGWLNLKGDVTVTFGELRILWIGRIIGAKKFSLTLNAPLLTSVYFGEDSISKVTLLDQTSVRYLEFQLDYNRSSLQFKDCEVIKCSYVLNLNKETLSELVRLPNLVELHCNVHEITALHYLPESDGLLRAIENIFDRLIAKHSELPPDRRAALNIYLHHVRITNRIQMRFDQYHFSGVLLSTHHRNRNFMAASVPSVKFVDYKSFQQVRVNHQFVSSLNDLYPCIQEVALKAPDSAAFHRPFMQFLRSRLSISHLDLQFLGFDSLQKQQLYDELPKLTSLCHSLTKLRLLDNARPNFGFLFQFELLHHFETNLMTTGDALDTVLKFKHPNFFQFHLKDCVLCIEKKTSKDELCLTIKEIRGEAGAHHTILYSTQTLSQLKETIESSSILAHQFDA